MASENGSEGFSAGPAPVPDFVPPEEAMGSTLEGPQAFTDRIQAIGEYRRSQSFENQQQEVLDRTDEMFRRHMTGGGPLPEHLRSFSRDVGLRKIGAKGTTHKRASWRIDISDRNPEKR